MGVFICPPKTGSIFGHLYHDTVADAPYKLLIKIIDEVGPATKSDRYTVLLCKLKCQVPNRG